MYRFATELLDINFGIMLKPKPSASPAGARLLSSSVPSLTRLPSTRMNSQQAPILGMIRATLPGTYVLQWDNSYSWVTEKKLHYSMVKVDKGVDECNKPEATQQL